MNNLAELRVQSLLVPNHLLLPWSLLHDPCIDYWLVVNLSSQHQSPWESPSISATSPCRKPSQSVRNIQITQPHSGFLWHNILITYLASCSLHPSLNLKFFFSIFSSIYSVFFSLPSFWFLIRMLSGWRFDHFFSRRDKASTCVRSSGNFFLSYKSLHNLSGCMVPFLLVLSET